VSTDPRILIADPFGSADDTLRNPALKYHSNAWLFDDVTNDSHY